MNLETLLKNNLIKKVNPDFKQIHSQLIRAKKDLFTKIILGEDYKGLIIRFDRIRRQRHDFIYDSQNNITLSEVKSALELAKELFEKIENIILKENPQKNFFIL